MIAGVLVTALVVFSQYTKQGRALRAVADDHQAALSVGISLRFIWVLTWSGRVKAEPERGLDAPGFYPSPARPGMLQLWTGVEWFPKFREPPAERP